MIRGDHARFPGAAQGARSASAARAVRHRAGWPVLTAEATPRLDADDVDVTVDGLVDTPTTWTLGRDPRRCRRRCTQGDIHCVTTWSKLDTTFTGVSVDTLFAAVARRCPTATFVVATSQPATRPTSRSTTSPAARRGWCGSSTAQPLTRATRRAGAAARAAPVLLEEREVRRRTHVAGSRRARFLGARTAITTAAIPGSSSATRGLTRPVRRAPTTRGRRGRPARGGGATRGREIATRPTTRRSARWPCPSGAAPRRASTTSCA